MLVIAAGLAGGYYVLGSRGEATAATLPTKAATKVEPGHGIPAAQPTNATVLSAYLARKVTVKTSSGPVQMTWAELGVEADPDEMAHSPVSTDADIATYAAKAEIPVRVDREKAIAALLVLKAKTDKSPTNAYLDLEEHKIYDDTSGMGLDIWGSLPRIVAAARQAQPTLELSSIAVPAAVTKTGLGIDDISQVMGHYETKFPVTDRDRNYNLKLAASKVNGYVMKPGEEWSFNGTVGERSQATGYKIAHVIEKGEMVDGLAGGTCQISTTLFGAAFFAGLEIVKTTNHSRPSAYTPLGFDATVVWPNTDLKLKNTYDFPVALRYVVANGEAKVEVLGKGRPFDKIVFEREVIETTPFSSEERLDEELPVGYQSTDQAGFDGYHLTRYRKFYKGDKLVKTNKWDVNYKPVTEYIRKGTNPDTTIKTPEPHVPKGLVPPKSDKFSMAQ
jgi:vancomycin resistance protein YoaR